MRIKLKFAFGKISEPSNFLDTLVIDDDEVEIRNGVKVCRMGFNRFRFSYHGEFSEVDLNLPPQAIYEPPYPLGRHRIELSHFSVLHIGEGDGWDVNRPSTSSVVIFNGLIFLIDASPHILHCPFRPVGIRHK